MASGTLGQIAADYPGRVGVVEMHVYQDYPLYLAEAIDRWHSYPPPCYGYYVIPWLWYDGNQHGGSDPLIWEDSIVNRMNQPSPVTITLAGYYSPSTGNGMLSAQFRNDSTATINAYALFVITEDSIYYVGPNQDSIHNHVARDFLPDHIGTGISLLAGDSMTVSQPFNIQQDWNSDNCNILVWLQDTTMMPDSTRNVYQCGVIKISNLGIEEDCTDLLYYQTISVMPNPCRERVIFKLNSSAGAEYSIRLFDVLGREVKRMKGISNGVSESVQWDCRDKDGFLIRPGIYFYQIRNNEKIVKGKVVVQ